MKKEYIFIVIINILIVYSSEYIFKNITEEKEKENKVEREVSIRKIEKEVEEKKPKEEKPTYIHIAEYEYFDNDYTGIIIPKGEKDVKGRYYVGETTPYGRLIVATPDGALVKSWYGEVIISPVNYDREINKDKKQNPLVKNNS